MLAHVVNALATARQLGPTHLNGTWWTTPWARDLGDLVCVRRCYVLARAS